MGNFTITQNTQIIKEFDSLSTFGTITPDGGGYIWSSDYSYILAMWGVTYAKSYMQWDIGKLKHVSSIDELWVISSVYKGYQTHSLCGIRAGEPLLAPNAATLHNWLLSSTTYAITTFTSVTSDSQYFTLQLNSQACTDMKNDISGSTDHFALAIRLVGAAESVTTDEQIRIRNINSVWGEPREPLLYVKYTVNNIVSLLQPNRLQRSSRRNLEFHAFKSGKFKQKDVGGEGRTIIMSGVQSGSGSETSLSYIDDMIELGEPITLSGFADSSLNDTWLIEDFTWEKQSGYDEGTTADRYDWELTLKEEETD